MEYMFYTFMVVGLVIFVLATWRFVMVRSKGTPVILRKLPAQGAHGWRHGSIRYLGSKIEYFRLRSLSPLADVILDRQRIHISARRSPSEREGYFMPPGVNIMRLVMGKSEYEMAIDRRGETAFLSWLESAPSQRLVRVDTRTAMRKWGKHSKRISFR